MKEIEIDSSNHTACYRLNKDHIVFISSPNINIFWVYVMDNNKEKLGQRCCKYTSLNEIEKLASEMLYDLGYNGEIMEFNITEGKACYYLPESNNLEYPVIIRYFRDGPFGDYLCKETVNNADDYLKALKIHQENRDTLKSIDSIRFEEISKYIYDIIEYAEGTSLQLQYMSSALRELLDRIDQGFREDYIDKLNEAYKMNTYLIDSVNEIISKIPKGLYPIYPNR